MLDAIGEIAMLHGYTSNQWFAGQLLEQEETFIMKASPSECLVVAHRA